MFDGLRDRLAGSLWFIPSLFSLAALTCGAGLSTVRPDPGSPFFALVFQGSAADARTLLATISATIVTVIALMLGLTVVALQMSSTMFSPRLLRHFLRDRPNQIALGVFVATFVYATAGLFTVGVGEGRAADHYPRLAVSGALVWLFASMAMVVYFADHVAHSIQVDAVMRNVERKVLRVMVAESDDGFEAVLPPVPAEHRTVLAASSGYLQAVHPDQLSALARSHGLHIRLRYGVGEHLVAGTPLASVWGQGMTTVAEATLTAAVNRAARVGFERTLEQDFGFGNRALLDAACKALSPAINDPYTALQALDHLTVIFRAMAARKLGARLVGDDHASMGIPGRTLQDHLVIVCGLLRRYGGGEPTVLRSVLRLLRTCAEVTVDPARLAAVSREAEMIAQTAQREMGQAEDAERVRSLADELQAFVAARGQGGPAQ